MKFAARDFDGLAKAPGSIAAALIYGTDAGQVRQRVEQLCEGWLGANADPMSRRELTAEELSGDPALLADEMAAMSLMADKRIVLLREMDDDKLLETIQGALTGRAPGNYLVAYSTETLPATSKLRQWAERAPDVACLPCYKDEGAALEGFIRDTLRGYGLKTTTEVLRYLAHQLSGDRQIIVNELEKLSLYVGDDAAEVTMEDAAASVGENNDRGMDELTHAVAMGDAVAICRLSDRLLAEGQHGMLLVRATLRALARIEQLCWKRAEGVSLDAAIESLRPPVFFKAKPLLRQSAQRWSPESCANALALLQQLEIDSKRHADNASARLAQGLLRVAALPGGLRRAA